MSDSLKATLENPLAKNFNLRSLLKFAAPTMIMMVFMGLYAIGDTIIISRFVNTDALSALNIVTPIINIIIGLGGMLATGCSALVAKKMGEGNSKRASQDFTLIALTGVIIGLIIASLGILFIDQIIRGLGASELLFPYCKKYLFMLLLFTSASICQVLFQNMIVVAGKPKLGMILAIGAGAANVILDIVFVGVCDMGIAGSALGTGIGYVIPTIIGFIFFIRTKGTLKFSKPIFDLKVIGKSSSNGFSEMVSQISAAVTTFIFNILMMKQIGEDGVAAITIIIYSQFLLTTLYIGFSMGVAPIISYNHGSRNYDNQKKIFKICFVFIATFSLIIFALSMLLGSPLVSIFSPKGTNVYEIARQGFWIFPISFLFCGFNIFASAMFTALSNGKVSATISLLRTLVFISASLLTLPLLWGVIGIWIAVPLAEILTIFVSLFFILKKKKVYEYL